MKERRWLQAGILFALFSAAVLSQANEYRSAGGSGGGSPGGSNGNVQINNSGSFGAYGGTTCASGFVTALDANGGSTCATPVPGAANAYNTIDEEGTGLTQRNTVNMIGDHVTCVDNVGLTRTDCTFVTPTPIATPTAYAAYDTVQEEGVGVTARRKLNVIGAYATCADNVGTSATDCTFVTPTPQAATAPGGANTQVQFNDGGAFGGDAGLVYGKTTDRLAMSGGTTGSAGTETGALFSLSGTLNATPSGAAYLGYFTATSAGSAAQPQVGLNLDFLSGYTGSKETVGLDFTAVAAGTGSTLSVGTFATTVANIGIRGAARPASGTGSSVGAQTDANNSTTTNVAIYGRTASAVAGNNIAVLGSARNSTEGTDLKNVGIYGTLSTSLITGQNVDSAGILDNGAVTGSILRGYDNSVLVFEIANVTGTAVNGFQFNGKATGSNPDITVTGDTDLGLDVILKGTGSFRAQHVGGRGTAPTIGGTCGTGPSISGTDIAGSITVGTGSPTSCVITFNSTWAAAPFCVLNDRTAISAAARFSATTTTTATVTVGTPDASAVLDFHCVG